ncbi:helix-turn-helix domain-containing protein [Micromonospora sp. WMMD1076]|uniref:helix-turn-helix domain-containing protein n=1 Tax=Micromonospora sp. WMMD1076 TaxID=3016103 RepID=UPI00249AEB3F|nr:helix-turn-helix domain-containing protein [Micromonospora sp. WMMD1076]WFF07894.1 helix-turn-helix domain-containing protein [Micromonospora sp. WMMD1076]
MRPTEPERSGSPAWDIAVPARPGRLAGVAMAGFSDRADAPVEVEVVPHPAIMMIFDLGDQPLVVDDGAGGQQRGCVTAGLAPPHGAQGRGQAGSFACLQVRLSPVIAHAVLGAASELSGAVTALDDLWGRDAARIQERLRAARSWDDRFAIAEAAVARRHDAGRAVDAEVAFCWRRMVAGRGQVRVERLAAEVGWSRKRLWARFRSQIGLTPKRAAQLIRFDDAAHRLAAGHSAAAAAADSGYADQSHLHRDVMTFTGATPATVAGAPFLAVDDVAWPVRP